MATLYYFPEPYPDELIGSVLVRASHHYGVSAKRMHGLLGLLPCADWPLLFQSQLEVVAQAMHRSPSDLLFNHTPFPYVTAFLSAKETGRLAHHYCSQVATTASALSQSVSVGSQGARYCEACIEADRLECGEDYWHRRHNLPLVTHCWKHGLPLREVKRHRTRFVIHELPHEQSGEVLSPVFDGSVQVEIERLSFVLLDSAFRQAPEQWQQWYRQMAFARGFPSHGSHLSAIALSQGFVSFFGAGRLEEVGLAVPLKRNPWPVTLLRNAQIDCVTAKHILMRVYLEQALAPQAVATQLPGPKPLDTEGADGEFASAILAYVAQLPEGRRLTVTELLMRLGILQPVRHHRKALPLTSAAIGAFRRSGHSARQVGCRPRNYVGRSGKN